MSITLNGTTGIDAPGVAIDGVAVGLKADVQEFTSSGTWTKPANAKLVYVEIWGGGGGGGSGRRGGNDVGGGGGGGGAAGNLFMFRASELTSTVSVTIGAGGAGGAAVTTNTTNGNTGSAGGDSSFGAYLTGIGAQAGLGGLNAVQRGGHGSGVGGALTVAAAGNTITFSGAAGSTSATSVPVALHNGGSGGRGGFYANADAGGATNGNPVLRGGLGCAGGGGGGGFWDAVGTNADGGIGGIRNSTSINFVYGGGSTAGVAGAAGSGFGNGGGGGGPGRTTAGGNGGAGAVGAGGGGGGGAVAGYNSGAGGAGGNGFCRVTTYS